MLVGRINKPIGKDVIGNGIGSIVGSPQFRHLSDRTKNTTRNFGQNFPLVHSHPTYIICPDVLSMVDETP
jgi:predicted amino acid dehydrogenase